MRLMVTFALAFSQIWVIYAEPAFSQSERPYIGGAVILGACVMEHHLKETEEYGERLREYIADSSAPSPSGSFPQAAPDYRSYFIELIGRCPDERYKATYTTAALTLQREDISSEDMIYFGKLVDENVLSIMMQEFAYDQ